LSGGEQQRVAVARALANQPALVLADEPTGNLDEATADIVFAEFLRLVRDEGSAALVATHNERIAGKMDRVLRLHEACWSRTIPTLLQLVHFVRAYGIRKSEIDLHPGRSPAAHHGCVRLEPDARL
jgi:ABC-type Mn2+/Zn2+ transport system ATPase subunit